MNEKCLGADVQDRDESAYAEEPLDEAFEIISEKEKLWRDFLVQAETNFLKSEASVLQNKAMIDLAKAEIKKESDKNAK